MEIWGKEVFLRRWQDPRAAAAFVEVPLSEEGGSVLYLQLQELLASEEAQGPADSGRLGLRLWKVVKSR